MLTQCSCHSVSSEQMKLTCDLILVFLILLQLVNGSPDNNVSSSMMKTFLSAITPNIDSKIVELQKVGADEDTQENVSINS